MRPLHAAVLLALSGAGVVPVLTVACVTRPRMCTAPTECPAAGVCVAGRCQSAEAGLTPTIAELGDAGSLSRRIVVSPVDVAWLTRGDGPRGPSAMPAVFTLGRARDGGAVLLTRFAVPLTKETQIIEAYLLLARSEAVDADPVPISLHAARVVDTWDSRSLSWSTQPRTQEVGGASTRVDGASRVLVRLDVRALVSRWALHDPLDQGIAVVAESSSTTGIPFAFQPTGAVRPAAPVVQPAVSPAFVDRGDRSSAPVEAPPVELLSPRLELYVK